MDPIAAIEESHAARLRLFRHWPAAEVHDTPALLRVTSAVPLAFFNSVLRARLDEADVEAAIAAVVAHYAARRAAFFWWTGPLDRPTDLGERLLARGLTRIEIATGMVADLEALPAPPAPADVTIERIVDVDGLRRWCAAYVRVHDLPAASEAAFGDSFQSVAVAAGGVAADGPLRWYLAHLAGEPVATSYVMLDGTSAGLYGVGVAAAHRRRGLGTAITLQPLRDAQALGYGLGVVRATDQGAPLYARLGFREVCRLPLFHWRPI